VLPQLLARDRTIDFLTPVRTYERSALSASPAAVRPS
jgi:hypothetical protein